MGQISFDLPPDLPGDVRDAALRGWFVGGYDGTPIPVRRRSDASRLTLQRTENESGNFCVHWPADGGRVVGSATLRLRPEPYRLLVELARGAVNRARTLAAAFDPTAAELTEPRKELAAVTRAFGGLVHAAATAADAVEVIERAGRLADTLVGVLTALRLGQRKAQFGPLATAVAARVDAVPDATSAASLTATYNAVRITPDWRLIEPSGSNYDWRTLDPLIEWANGAGLPVCLGPVVDLTARPLPEWLGAADSDLPTLAAYLSDYLATVYGRYRGKVRTWLLFNGFNHSDEFGLTEDDRLRLAGRLLETAQELDPQTDWHVGVRQPWGDYLRSEDYTYSPLVFADTLLRAGFPVRGIELEVPLTAGRPTRDVLDTVQLVELFDNLCAPLSVSFVGRADAATFDWAATAAAVPSVRGMCFDGGTTAALDAALRKFRGEWLT